jgi:hypothetical protein
MFEDEKIDPNGWNRNGLSIIHRAVKNNEYHMVMALIAHERVKPNILTRGRRHVLDLAASPQMLQLLLDNKRIKLNNLNCAHYSFYHQAVIDNKHDLLKVILSH